MTRSRRWRLPPAIQRGAHETIDRLGILSEHGEIEGCLLWRFVRDVELWAVTPPMARANLFTKHAAESRTALLRESKFPPPVSTPLASLTQLLLSPSESPSSSTAVSTACFMIAVWARAAGAKETAVGFAQAAALASPDAPRYALLTGECAEELGQSARAVTWFQRTVALGRRAKDWSAYSLGFLALGAFAEAEGRMEAAHRAYARAFRTSRRHGLRSERARASYRLFRLARHAGDKEMATVYARIATHATATGVGPGTREALDLLDYWITHRRGMPVRRLLTHLAQVENMADGERFTVALFRVRAAIAAREPITAKRAWADAWELAVAAPGSRADALLQLASLASRLKDFDGVGKAGRAALVHAEAEDYERVRSELRRIGGPHVSFDPRASRGAA